MFLFISMNDFCNKFFFDINNLGKKFGHRYVPREDDGKTEA